MSTTTCLLYRRQVALCDKGKGEASDNNMPPGGLPYESDGDARRKIRINTLKETNLGVAPALFNP